MCPQGKTSRFRQQSGIFSVKNRVAKLIITVWRLSRNLRSPVPWNTVVTAVTLAIGENGSKIAYFSHSTQNVPLGASKTHFAYEVWQPYHTMPQQNKKAKHSCAKTGKEGNRI